MLPLPTIRLEGIHWGSVEPLVLDAGQRPPTLIKVSQPFSISDSQAADSSCSMGDRIEIAWTSAAAR